MMRQPFEEGGLKYKGSWRCVDILAENPDDAKKKAQEEMRNHPEYILESITRRYVSEDEILEDISLNKIEVRKRRHRLNAYMKDCESPSGVYCVWAWNDTPENREMISRLGKKVHQSQVGWSI